MSERKEKFTPGDWDVVDLGNCFAIRGDGGGHLVAFTNCGSRSHSAVEHGIGGREEEEANARALAAMPTLYEALQAWSNWDYEVQSAKVNGEGYHSASDLAHMRAEAVKKTDAALAKARGEA